MSRRAPRKTRFRSRAAIHLNLSTTCTLEKKFECEHYSKITIKIKITGKVKIALKVTIRQKISFSFSLKVEISFLLPPSFSLSLKEIPRQEPNEEKSLRRVPPQQEKHQRPAPREKEETQKFPDPLLHAAQICKGKGLSL